jgi:hypothetical protein
MHAALQQQLTAISYTVILMVTVKGKIVPALNLLSTTL